MASKCSRGRKSDASLTFNQKLEVTKLSEEGERASCCTCNCTTHTSYRVKARESSPPLGTFVFLTYVLGVAWLGVFGFSAVPVFMFYNIWSTCEVIKSPQTNGTAAVEQICVDIRQYGIIPWNAFPGRICGSALENICNTNEFYMSYHLFIVACAGAGATVVALIHFLMILSSNWAYLKDASKMQAYQDIKAKEEQELQDIQSRSKEQLNSYT
ncbi:neuronal membrane glycoprotein M6-b [Leptonychotes weddellii]|uniref:Neuronal membrane glycoprotein M6-b n=1 Tax=Leptonychotes weddellii TaxID=9713 RepID=A0A2U3YVX0_LEPWE|nr:neuronal membrane glycoprotein M6-b [Leptonychotes weddellii]